MGRVGGEGSDGGREVGGQSDVIKEERDGVKNPCGISPI